MSQDGMMKSMMGGRMMQGASQTGAGQSLLTKTDSQGPVTVKVGFDAQQQTERGKLVSKVEMDTHSVELGNINLGQLSVLRNENGEQVNPSELTSPAGDGHHVKGTLTFPSLYGS